MYRISVEDWLNDNELAINIWRSKYQFNNESFDGWLDRVSGGDKELKQKMLEKKFLFGGRILSNRGLEKHGKKVTMSNCYVVKNPEDNIEDIYRCCSDIARTFSMGGGCGIVLDKLRPRGANVNNSARTTTGAVSFMETFSKVSETIGQNGRRGALMIALDANHPDIMEFIDIKTDLNKILGANISVKVDDEFMRKVLSDDVHVCEFYVKETNEVIRKEFKAREVFERLVSNNYDYAEPGILYWDTFNKFSLLNNFIKEGLFEYGGVNPCLVGDTLISTIHGEIPIKDLVGQQPYVYCVDDDGKLDIRQASKVWMTRRNAELVEVDFYRGKIVCTPDHLIYTMNRGWVKAIDLKPKDKLNGLGISSHQYKVLRLTSQGAVGKEHRFIASKMYGDLSGMDVHHIDGNKSNNDWDNLEVLPHGQHSKVTNEGHESFIGRDELGRFKEGEGKGKKVYEPLKYNESIKGKNFIVKKVTKLDYVEDVYDMTVPDVHNFIANGIEVHNCAEEPLPEGGACLLGSINLSEYVINPFTDDAFFDTYEFVNDIPIYIKALNDVLDENLDIHPLDYQCKVARDWRQIGLGVMGIADVFIKMGIRYGSEESIKLLDRIGHVLAYTALHTSCQMNKEAEVPAEFCKRCPDYLAYSQFVQEHSNLDTDNYALFEEIRQFGLYNSALLTVAPTGTLSTMLGISGGIEPIFAKSYERRTISLHEEETKYKVYTPIIQKLMDRLGIANEEDLPSYVVTAHDLDPYERVKLQATMQKHIDASISSTINLNEEATKEDVFNIYVEAWKEGCKGITIFRNNCKRTAILTTEPSKEEKVTEGEAIPSDIVPRGYILPTNDNVIGLKKKLSGGCGSLHLQVYFDVETGKMTEVFINKGGGGGCNSNLNALSRMISLALRGGIDIHDIADQLDSTINCPSFASARAKGIQLSKGSSCANSVGKALVDLNKDFQKMFALMQEEIEDEYIEEEVHHNIDAYAEYKVFIKKHGEVEFVKSFHLCPMCFSPIVASGGCYQCDCGWTKCE